MINGPSRRALFAGTLASLAASPSSPASAAVRGGLPFRPNILVILADDLGWGELGSYGQRLIKTPNLDRMAAEGVRFTDAYAGAPICAPSRCALLTGLHAGHGTVRENPGGGPQHALTAADLTFGELLNLSGYRTACIGKWGFGPDRPGQPSHPNERGFEEFYGYIGHKHAHQYFPKYLWHNGEKVGLDGRQYAPDLFRRRAVSYIEQHRDEPFLLYYPTNLPHAPSVVPGDTGPYERRPWSEANRRHAAQITRLDRDVAALTGALRANGLAERTLVLFLSDNGPHHEQGVTPDLFDANGPYRSGKRAMYEGGLRVPMIAWSPALRPRVVRQPVAGWDLMPTLADLAGVPVPAQLDGVSFRGLLTGANASRHKHLVWNRPGKAQAIRRGRWKAVRIAPDASGTRPERVELYDLTTDPGERRDLAAARPELAAELAATLDAEIGEDPRIPYGLRSEVVGDELVVTLENGSGVPWNDVVLGVDGPRKTRASKVQRVEPGMAISVGFPLPAAGAGRLVARAAFRALGRSQLFRRPHARSALASR
ncbi:arylsulfatase [Nonomuraea wenchangensis]|uniref:arylsulfatase n=1 Tax=Nonomuraea wenchangensis TaxID=568860 RepID=UPI0037168A02